MDKGIIMFVYEEAGKQRIAFSNEFDKYMASSPIGQSILNDLLQEDPDNEWNVDMFRNYLYSLDESWFGSEKSNKLEDVDFRDTDGWDETGMICYPDAKECLRFIFAPDGAENDIEAVINEYKLHTDYFYIKNATNNPIEFTCNFEEKTFVIPPKQVAITHYNELVNNKKDKEGFGSNLIGLEPVKSENCINVNWEGDIYVEISPLTQKSYDELLRCSPSDPNYVGEFKELQNKYFEYLQAKGRGEDVKSPITINNLKKPYNIEYYNYSFGNNKHREFLNSKVYVDFISDINLDINGFKTKTDTFTREAITDTIKKSVMADKKSGSFELESPVLDFGEINDCYHSTRIIGSAFDLYLEQSSRIDKLFAEFQDTATGECLLSFEIKYNPANELPVDGYTVRKAVAEQYEAFIGDYDLEEKRIQDLKQKEEGNYYDYAISHDFTVSREEMKPDRYLPFNFDPTIQVNLTAYLQFKKKDLNLTTYYKYCDPDKISFKDFKDANIIPLSVLNKDSLDKAREEMRQHSYTYQNFSYPLHSSFTTDRYSAPKSAIGEKRFEKLVDDLVASEKVWIKPKLDMSENIKRCFDQDFEIFNLKDYGDEVGGSFIYRNLEFEFDYNPIKEEINLMYFDYSIEDNETGYYKQLDLPPLLQNEAVQDMLIDQIDLQVNTFIAENRYGSLDDLLEAAEIKSKSSISKESKSIDDIEL